MPLNQEALEKLRWQHVVAEQKLMKQQQQHQQQHTSSVSNTLTTCNTSLPHSTANSKQNNNNTNHSISSTNHFNSNSKQKKYSQTISAPGSVPSQTATTQSLSLETPATGMPARTQQT